MICSSRLGKNYKLHLPPNIPVKHLSVIVYSNQTRSILQIDQQFRSVSSQTKGLLVNADGSVDVYFGPTAPAGEDKNWVQTNPRQRLEHNPVPLRPHSNLSVLLTPSGVASEFIVAWASSVTVSLGGVARCLLT
jgi:Protein of unknown function (DUF1214)